MHKTNIGLREQYTGIAKRDRDHRNSISQISKNIVQDNSNDDGSPSKIESLKVNLKTKIKSTSEEKINESQEKPRSETPIKNEIALTESDETNLKPVSVFKGKLKILQTKRQLIKSAAKFAGNIANLVENYKELVEHKKEMQARKEDYAVEFALKRLEERRLV